jgi:hypothetical protein
VMDTGPAAGVTEGVGVGEGVGVTEGVGVGEGVGVTEGVGVGEGVGVAGGAGVSEGAGVAAAKTGVSAGPLDAALTPAGAARAVSQSVTTATTLNALRPCERVEVRNATIPLSRCRRVWARRLVWVHLGPAEHRRSRRADKWYGGPGGGYPVAPARSGDVPPVTGRNARFPHCPTPNGRLGEPSSTGHDSAHAHPAHP